MMAHRYPGPDFGAPPDALCWSQGWGPIPSNAQCELAHLGARVVDRRAETWIVVAVAQNDHRERHPHDDGDQVAPSPEGMRGWTKVLIIAWAWGRQVQTATSARSQR